MSERLQSTYRKGILTDPHARFCAMLDTFGIRYETEIPVVRYDKLRCGNCGNQSDSSEYGFNPSNYPLFLVAKQFSKFPAFICAKCHKEAVYPMTYQTDILLWPLERKTLIEVIGKGSSSKDPKRRAYFKSQGIATFPVPNSVANDADAAEAYCYLLVALVGTDKPGMTF